MLTLRNLQIGYSSDRPVAAVPDLTVRNGDFVCLLGRNGKGKSTLLRTLAGLSPPLSGVCLLDADEIGRLPPVERARRIGVVLTDRPQLPGMIVEEVVELGRLPFTGSFATLTPKDQRLAAEALQAVEGDHLAGRYLDTLSDGERQRVMIARALAQQPQLLLLDEITAFLDLPSRVTLSATLRRIARDRQIKIILSSHDLELSLQTADALWLLPGDGALLAGAPEDLALKGALGRAFDHADIAFSVETGRFEPTAASGRPAFVKGEGPAAAWARRALNRAGWRVLSDGEAAEIVIDAEGSLHQVRWSLSCGGRTQTFERLEDLVRTVGASQ